MLSKKYPRSLHATISLGTTSDDRFMPKGYLKEFSKYDKLVLTEKLDGQNNCFNKKGVYARSHTAPTIHPWDKPMRERWNLIKDDIDDLEFFGENMYGIHSIEYKHIDSYFYIFGIREKGKWLSWDEVKFIAALYDFPTVPEIEIKTPLKDFISQFPKDEDKALEEWFKDTLGMSWEAYTETPGVLGGFDPNNNKPVSEGFVVRNYDGFYTNDDGVDTAENEFNNLFKLVRSSHVKTDVHWTKTWKPAKLTDYTKYNWHQYAYLSNLNK